MKRDKVRLIKIILEEMLKRAIMFHEIRDMGNDLLSDKENAK